MDKSTKGQGCEGKAMQPLPSIISITHANNAQLSIAEERDRRRAYAIAGH